MRISVKALVIAVLLITAGPVQGAQITVSPAGGGDVFGPASATDNALVRWDGATGKLVQNSAATLDDAGVLTASNLRSNGLANFGGLIIINQSPFSDEYARVGAGNYQMISVQYFGWTSSATSADGSLVDLRLYRDAANTLAQRNGTNAQALRVYNTFTDASNYERGSFDWATTANWLRIGTNAGGSGTGRNMYLDPAGGIIGIAGATASFPALKRSSAILQVRLADDSANAAFEASTIDTDGYTVAGLPAAGVAGRRAYVTDQAAACVGAGAALTGGGAVVCPVFDNGAAWVGD